MRGPYTVEYRLSGLADAKLGKDATPGSTMSAARLSLLQLRIDSGSGSLSMTSAHMVGNGVVDLKPSMCECGAAGLEICKSPSWTLGNLHFLFHAWRSPAEKGPRKKSVTPRKRD